MKKGERRKKEGKKVFDEVDGGEAEGEIEKPDTSSLATHTYT